ncbi:LD-carboxypeptidase LdcB, LAS superfamily [Arsukibacterium tuosuense]|uniref:LD-carboxypeptidase LdcB, LAS superfamily n=1 Tax=Arsukibacterium tuosuense TaxID=1323745 RepID=A0A285ISK5_9GAMM|nr:M15 family metallopeptidase [Arsukibacterium tuosuense]SNY50677.1 LD-carboxypeptidase LdcB, LAS superfamily [Arsukibacterium tuosuense]
MNIVASTADILTGRSQSHLTELADGHLIHRQMCSAWLKLQQAAALDGMEIKIVSAFRSFQRQATIWQAKCDGLRPVYNLAQQQVDITALTGLAKLDAILLYSALPGASRHHWGTELDVYDASAVAENYQPQLLQTEYQDTGPFTKLNQWLRTEASKFGFFRPYNQYQGGVAAEPWHLSYAPLANPYLQALTLDTLKCCLQQHPVAEQQCVLANLAQLYQTYVINICEDI